MTTTGDDVTDDEDEPTVRDVIAAGLTSAEREFAVRVGQGAVRPGDYLSDRDRADVVLRELAERGYRVVRG